MILGSLSLTRKAYLYLTSTSSFLPLTATGAYIPLYIKISSPSTTTADLPQFLKSFTFCKVHLKVFPQNRFTAIITRLSALNLSAIVSQSQIRHSIPTSRSESSVISPVRISFNFSTFLSMIFLLFEFTILGGDFSPPL